MSGDHAAAIGALLGGEGALRRFAGDETLLDFLCALSHACRRADIGVAALAACATDEDAAIAAAARVLLRERTLLEDDGPQDASGNGSAASLEPVRCRDIVEALDVARTRGVRVLEAPRAFFDAIGRGAPRETADGIALVPPDCAQAAVLGIEFRDSSGTPFSLADFARGVGVAADALEPKRIRCAQSTAAAAAQWCATRAAGASDYDWPVGEPGGLVAAGPMTFSASRLNSYVKCPRRWFFEYLCACLDDRPSPQAVYGKVFHDALETLHAEVRIPSQWKPEDVHALLVASLDAAFGRAYGEFETQLEYETSRLRARRVADHYVRWLFAQAQAAPFEIVQIESREAVSIGGHGFVGYIDRVDRPLAGGPITIYDYKTGRIEEDPREYLRSVRSGDEAQLALYYAMREARGDEVGRIALVSLRDARDKTWVLALDIRRDAGETSVVADDGLGAVRAACSPEDLRVSMAALTARCDLLTREGVEHFGAGADPPCGYCAYERACRDRPADGERIFAR